MMAIAWRTAGRLTWTETSSPGWIHIAFTAAVITADCAWGGNLYLACLRIKSSDEERVRGKKRKSSKPRRLGLLQCRWPCRRRNCHASLSLFLFVVLWGWVWTFVSVTHFPALPQLSPQRQDEAVGKDQTWGVLWICLSQFVCMCMPVFWSLFVWEMVFVACSRPVWKGMFLTHLSNCIHLLCTIRDEYSLKLYVKGRDNQGAIVCVWARNTWCCWLLAAEKRRWHVSRCSEWDCEQCSLAKETSKKKLHPDTQ